MEFIYRDNAFFSNLNNKETVLYTAEKDTYIKSISVCNMCFNTDFIRISLKATKSLNVPSPITVNKLNNIVIKKNMTEELTEHLNDSPFLKNGDSLIIYSNGYSEIFDCTIHYEELNESLNEYYTA